MEIIEKCKIIYILTILNNFILLLISIIFLIHESVFLFTTFIIIIMIILITFSIIIRRVERELKKEYTKRKIKTFFTKFKRYNHMVILSGFINLIYGTILFFLNLFQEITFYEYYIWLLWIVAGLISFDIARAEFDNIISFFLEILNI